MKLFLSQITGKRLPLTDKIKELPGVMTFRFGSSGAKWQAGQYYVFFIPSALKDKRSPFRPFSISSAPSEEYIQFSTRIGEQSSLFKKGLLDLTTGERVWAFGPFGSFTVQKDAKHHIFLAGGIGITAFRSIIKEASLSGNMPKITLLYSNRDTNILFKEELDQLTARCSNLTVHYLGGDARINAVTVAKFIKSPQRAQFYISGPPLMVKDVSRQLSEELNISKGHIHKDSFKGYPWPL